MLCLPPFCTNLYVFDLNNILYSISALLISRYDYQFCFLSFDDPFPPFPFHPYFLTLLLHPLGYSYDVSPLTHYLPGESIFMEIQVPSDWQKSFFPVLHTTLSLFHSSFLLISLISTTFFFSSALTLSFSSSLFPSPLLIFPIFSSIQALLAFTSLFHSHFLFAYDLGQRHYLGFVSPYQIESSILGDLAAAVGVENSGQIEQKQHLKEIGGIVASLEYCYWASVPFSLQFDFLLSFLADDFPREDP